ncbi:hypothetical protein DMB65_08020 [Flavobacterium cheongpyeongense]|uniref:Dihydrolipoamide dehydrogenase n=1 Tax=Flavobacterium cheongpyeongense TaxID=2212651 RepID=A0A2V4BUC3_9FLAO|nr:hypothetical protein [Flavobacterium cheongpyeongense]PXY41340.1 hypothetical protein DMB65_08020 [Flavobacterium cheongpyeongense]
MKKILTLFAVVGLFAFTSCEGPEGPEGAPGQNVNKVFEILNEDFDYNNDDGYNIYGIFNPLIGDASTILIYRLAGTIDSNTPVWQLIPRTIYLSNNRELDYDYDFSKEDFKIYVRANYDMETTAADYLDNQTFRVVIVPGSFTNKSSVKPDYSDYYEVIKKYNIDDSNVKKIN